jgi:hypothetical protein
MDQKHPTNEAQHAMPASPDGQCPKCHSNHIQAISTTSSKGFGTGKGLLGCCLLGPLGFLCGLCGMGKSKTTHGRMCLNCGTKF